MGIISDMLVRPYVSLVLMQMVRSRLSFWTLVDLGRENILCPLKSADEVGLKVNKTQDVVQSCTNAWYESVGVKTISIK